MHGIMERFIHRYVDMKLTTVVLAILVMTSCQSFFRPYKCGPILKTDDLDIFRRQAEYLGLRPGVVFADVGASSGYHDGAMAISTEGVTYYMNDIDQHCLNEKNMNRMLAYYSSLKKADIAKTNTFLIVIGAETSTGLPEKTFDVIFTNATLHVLDQPDSILIDIKRKLKPGGYFFVRDEIVYDGSIKFCDPRRCGHQVLQYEPFMEMMNRNGFELVGESRDFGHPIFKFAVK